MESDNKDPKKEIEWNWPLVVIHLIWATAIVASLYIFFGIK